jgi:autotransporter-associated beta strand protein
VNLILGGGALQYTSGSVNGSTNRNFTLANGTSNTMNVATSGISLTISGNAAASTGSLTKTGSGILVLSGANAYTGSTTISSGTLSVASINNGGVAGGLGSSSANAANLILDGGTLLFTGSTASTDRGFTLANGKNSTISVTGSSATLTISGNSAATTTGGLIKNGASTLSLTGSNGFSGSVSVVNGTLNAATIGNQGESSSLGSGAAILLGSGSNTVGLTYTGTGQVSNKTIDLSGTTGGVYISQSGSSGTLNFTSNFTATGNGSKTIYLQGSTAGIGQISGTIEIS